MHTHDLSRWQHEHVCDTGNAAGERSTRLVMWLTAVWCDPRGEQQSPGS